MAAPVELTDALAAAGAALADLEMKQLLLEQKVLAKYKADKSDPKYLQYKQEYEEIAGEAQTARSAIGQPKTALINYYLSNPADFDALFGIA